MRLAIRRCARILMTMNFISLAALWPTSLPVDSRCLQEAAHG
jgi:hypothetical protein